jgi:all-trans-retinol dehydrogenase (NAD+)
MIERKRGHIVGISSMAGKSALPCAIAYTSTKHAVTGFMNSLYDEICAYDCDKFIKTTAVYPWFINTRKELEGVLEIYGSILKTLTPESVAMQIVDSVLKNQREVTIPNAAKLLIISK